MGVDEGGLQVIIAYKIDNIIVFLRFSLLNGYQPENQRSSRNCDVKQFVGV